MSTKFSVLALAATATVSFARVSEDFEAGLDKSTWPTYAPDCNQGGTVSLDTTTAHSGRNSVKVVGAASGYCGHIFFGTTQVPASGDVYVRTWLQVASSHHSSPDADGRPASTLNPSLISM